MSKRFILCSLLVLCFLPPLHAQTAPKSPDYSSARTPGATPQEAAAADGSSPNPMASASRAPDELMKRLSDLVHAGKYAEARQSVSALLILYPDDQRLVKAKTLLEQALAPSKPADSAGAAGSHADGVTPPVLNTSPEKYSGMEKVDYEALKDLARQAQETADLSQQKSLLTQFMAQSALFLQKHPGEMLLWQLRAASAMNLNDPTAGFEAGQKLLAADAAGIDDPNSQRLLAQLKNKGWLDERGIAEAKQKIEEDREYGWLLGTWSGTNSWFQTAAFDYGKKQVNARIEFVRSGSNVLGYLYRMNSNTRYSVPVLMYTPSGNLESDPARGWSFNRTGVTQKWQPIDSISFDGDRSTMEINIGYEKTKFIFKKVADAQTQ